MLHNFNVCDEVTPVNVDDGAQTAQMKALGETNETAVGDSGLQKVEESGKNHGSVDPDFCLVLQVFVIPNTFVQSAK